MMFISSGEPSTLGTYLKIAKAFGKECEDFIKAKIAKSPKGENEEVIQAESQVLYLFGYIAAGKVKMMGKGDSK